MFRMPTVMFSGPASVFRHLINRRNRLRLRDCWGCHQHAHQAHTERNFGSNSHHPSFAAVKRGDNVSFHFDDKQGSPGCSHKNFR
jgi:hypothetical protein